MAPRSRVVAFGSAGLLVVAGAACGLLIDGAVGQVLLLALILAGLGGALLLVFFEVGLSEDQEREREEQRRRNEAPGRSAAARPRRIPRRPRRPG